MTDIQKAIYIALFVFILWTLKPSLLFKPNGKPRQYGVGYDEEGYKKTVFTAHLIIIIFVVLMATLKYR